MEKVLDISKIHIVQKYFSIIELITMVESGELVLQNNFGNENHAWTVSQKSHLIESIMLNLPIPFLLIDGEDYGDWRIIDGVERLKAIMDFYIGKSEKDEFVLKDTFFLPRLEGKSYKDLSRPDQRHFLQFDFLTYITQIGTPQEAKLALYKNSR